MWNHFGAIAQAQFRTMRNHLPRTTFGSILMGVLAALWYALFAALGVGACFVLSQIPAHKLQLPLTKALFGAFLFWQWMPLLTMSGGWSLQLKKLQIYPISTSAFFWIETVLRLSAAPELLLLVLGAATGLLINSHIPRYGGLFLLAYLPFNLFVTLAVRETLLHSFARSRFRELFAVLVIGVAVLPQMVMRTELGHRLRPFWTALTNARWTPWNEFARLSSGHFAIVPCVGVAVWMLSAWWIARVQFSRSLRVEETLRANSRRRETGGRNLGARFATTIAGLFRDPMSAVIEKEIRSLLRMPRFRVIFGMACVFSIVIFFPVAFGYGSATWVRENFLPVVNLYGLLLLGDTLLWNVFGFDRSATQVWFLAGLNLRMVLKAKNITAAVFIVLQNATVLLVATALRFPLTTFNVFAAACSSVVVGVYFLAIGNLSSVTVPRAVDPSQTLRKQAGAQLQLWLLGSALTMGLLVGFAYLARWAFDTDWALMAIFVVEFGIGLIVYRFALDSAVHRGMRDRERILDALSKSAAPVSV